MGCVVIDIAEARPSWPVLWKTIEREMRIRFYRPRSIRSYRMALRQLAKWFRRPPDELTSEHIRSYLDWLVSKGTGASWLSVNITAIRTCFDKMGGLALAGSLRAPKRPRALPAVLSQKEVVRLITAAPTLRDKLILSLMYACGLRVSEVCRLRWRDVDSERFVIRVVRGKGAKDRLVLLPKLLLPLLLRGKETCGGDAFVFPGDREGKHLTTRAAQIAMKRAKELAAIEKNATCHTLRHSFATHMIEHGTDIRFVQELLGHMRLETTRLYTHVAATGSSRVESPLDRLESVRASILPPGAPALPNPNADATVRLRIRLGILRRNEEGRWESEADVAIESGREIVELLSAKVIEPRDGWIVIDLPPAEAWLGKLARLPAVVVAKLTSIEFYDRLRTVITGKFLARRNALSARSPAVPATREAGGST